MFCEFCGNRSITTSVTLTPLAVRWASLSESSVGNTIHTCQRCKTEIETNRLGEID